MKLSLILVGLHLFYGTSLSADCSGKPGEPNGECVKFYAGSGCRASNIEGSYKPTCGGNCYVYPFGSLVAFGDGFYGTNCVAYSDNNCQNELGSTGNSKGGSGCKTFSAGNGAQSMKCYYRC